jgi:hypothetical protein
MSFEPIASAEYVEEGVVADLKMPSGRVYRAAWARRGIMAAWWPLIGARRRPIGLYDPVGWRRVDAVTALNK